MTTSSLLNPAYKHWLESKTNPYETIILLEKSEVSNVDLSDISEALEEYVRLFKAEIASPAEILTLSRAYPDEEKYSLAVIDKELDQEEPVVIGGPASVEVVDREGHIITLAAMKRAFERFMANFRTRNAMVLHSDVQVGWALPAYISKTGKIYKSGVTGDHLFFITELRDDTKIAKKVLDQIGTGKMKSYSIAGSATSVEPSQRDGAVVMQVNDMELAEVTICEQGVNQKAKFELMKSDTDRPTSSCVDGSCLIKADAHTHSNTEVFMDEEGIIDTVGSFANWVQKNEEFNDPQERPRLAPAAIPVHDTDKAARSRKRVDAGKGQRQVAMWNKYTKHKEKDEPSGNEVLEAMRKSHLEGCLCDSCKQRTGDTNGDDTARMATDTQGRPTLGHTGHGNAVAIIISRMQRKSKGNPGPGKKGRPQYKKEQYRREVEAVGHGDNDPTKENRAYGRWRKHHPQSEDYRGGKSSLPYDSPAKRLADAKRDEHDENMRNDPNYYNPMDVYDEDTMPGGGLDRPDPRHNPDRTPAHRKWQANPARYPALNTPPEHYEDKGYARRERAKEAEAKGLGRGPDTRAMRSKSPPGGDTGRHVQSMQKAVYEYINKAFEVPSRKELEEAGDKRKAAALAAAKEKHGEGFTPAKPKVQPYRGSAPQKTGDEREAAARKKFIDTHGMTPEEKRKGSSVEELMAFVKAATPPINTEGDATNPARGSTQYQNPKPDIGASVKNPEKRAAEAKAAATGTADVDEKPDMGSVQQQPTNMASSGGGGRGFLNDLLDLYEGRGEGTRTSAAPAQTPQMQVMEQLEMSLDYFKNRKGS